MRFKSHFQNKVVIVTGASMGIGKEVARQLLDLGAKVAITGRTLSKLEKVADEFSNHKEDLLLHAGDVADMGSNLDLVKSVVDRFGRLDYLINNAGMSGYGALKDMDPEVYKSVVDTNIYGSVFPTKACLPELMKSKGGVLFVSSVAGMFGLPDYSAYSVSKMALIAQAQSLRTEMKGQGVFVGIAYVGFTENESNKRTYTPEGGLEEVPARPKMLTASRSKTAQRMLKQLARRRKSKNHSPVGKVVMTLSRLFPSLLAVGMQKGYKDK